MNWKDKINECIEQWDKKTIVVSPDVDGFLTAAILSNIFGSKVIGYYNARSLYIERGYNVDDCIKSLWLDHDIDHTRILCIGQHLVNGTNADALGRRNTYSFNPNQFLRQAYNDSFLGVNGLSRDKYPFGTAHLFIHLLKNSWIKEDLHAIFCHADSARAVSNTYRMNTMIWLRQLFDLETLPFVGMDGKQFDFDTVKGSLDSDVWALSPTIESQLHLVRRLRDAKVPGRSAAVRQRELIGVPSELRGTQSVNIKRNMKVETITSNIANAVSALFSKTNLKLDVGSIDPEETVHGEFHRVYPSNKYKDGELDEFLNQHKVFSHAFVAQSALQFTTMSGTALFEH